MMLTCWHCGKPVLPSENVDTSLDGINGLHASCSKEEDRLRFEAEKDYDERMEQAAREYWESLGL